MAEVVLIANLLCFLVFYDTISYPFAMEWPNKRKCIIVTPYSALFWYFMPDSCSKVDIEWTMVDRNVHIFSTFFKWSTWYNFFQNFIFFINHTEKKKNHSSLQWYMAIGLLIWAYILINFFMYITKLLLHWLIKLGTKQAHVILSTSRFKKCTDLPIFCQSLVPIGLLLVSILVVYPVSWIALLCFHALLFPFYHRSIKIDTMIINFSVTRTKKDEWAKPPMNY